MVTDPLTSSPMNHFGAHSVVKTGLRTTSEAARTSLRRVDAPVDWALAPAPVDYPFAVEVMEARAAAIANGEAAELVWLLEHPPLYTAGSSAKPGDLLRPDALPVYATGRGGQYTYHGPGQRVAYVMLNLSQRGRDVRAFVHGLETWIIATLAQFDVTGETRAERVGVWVTRPDASGSPREDKIAALGVRLRRWVSFHGVAINVAPDLSHFEGIVPCGVHEHGVTSLADLGLATTMTQVDAALRTQFEVIFGATVDAPAPKQPETANVQEPQ